MEFTMKCENTLPEYECQNFYSHNVMESPYLVCGSEDDKMNQFHYTLDTSWDLWITLILIHSESWHFFACTVWVTTVTGDGWHFLYKCNLAYMYM